MEQRRLNYKNNYAYIYIYIIEGLIFITVPSRRRDAGHVVTPVAMIIPILSSEKHH